MRMRCIFEKMFDFETQVCIEKAKSMEDGLWNNRHSLGILVFTQARMRTRDISDRLFLVLIMENSELHGFHLLTLRFESANTVIRENTYHGCCRTDHKCLREAYGDSISSREVKS